MEATLRSDAPPAASDRLTLALVSDIHYAGAAEQARTDYSLAVIENPLRRLAIRLYRRFVWQRDPFAHNHLLDQFLEQTGEAAWAVAVGDYSCNSAFIGVSDPAACASAAECLQKLRQRFGSRLRAVLGDHELGKKPLGGTAGGLRLDSLRQAREALALEPFWELTLGRYRLIGVTSTLLALPVYEPETLPAEWPGWEQARAEQLEHIRQAFASLQPKECVLLFCHDPTALPFLWREESVRAKLPQLERTVIGHLHSPLILWQSRLLSGMPVLRWFGHTPRRLSRALREARHWKPFRPFLCPALAGIELLKDGGYGTVELDPDGSAPARFQRHWLPR